MTVGVRPKMPASIAPVKRGGFSACPARSTLEARISTQTISKAVNMTVLLKKSEDNQVVAIVDLRPW